jgi:hypothetical protein
MPRALPAIRIITHGSGCIYCGKLLSAVRMAAITEKLSHRHIALQESLLAW